MARVAGFWKKIADGWTVQRIAAVLIVVGLVVFVVGVVNKHCMRAGWPNFGDTLNDIISDFYANVSVDSLSIAFAILVLDRLNERRAEQQLKAQLIREMGSTDNAIALRAVRELRGHGSEDDNWLTDGSLKGAYLIRPNLQGAELPDANLQEAILQEANLQRAFLFGANLQKVTLIEADLQGADLLAANLQEADLPGAKLQEAKLARSNMQKASLFRANLQEVELDQADLREANLQEADLQGAHLYQVKLQGANLLGTNLQEALLWEANLQGVRDLTDLQLVTAASLRGATMCDGSRYDGRLNLKWETEMIQHMIEDDEAMSRWYGVPLESYLAGQKWARENLPRLRREAGLDPETGLPVEPTNGTEPQLADAPAQPAPPRNGQRHKASIVTHRTRR